MKTQQWWMVAAIVGAVLAGGCESQAQKHREDAKARWAESRSEMLTKFAQGAYMRGEMARAREQVDEAVRMAPKHAPLYVLAARLALEKGEPDMAVSYAKTAVEIDPKSTEAQYVLGTAEQAVSRLDKALEAFSEAAKLDPASEAYLLAEVEMHVALDQLPVAAEKLQSAVSRMAGRPAVHMAYGDLLFLVHEYEQAAGSYRVAQRLDSTRPELPERLAAALYYSGAYGEAESILADLGDPKKESAPAWVTRMRADCLLALGRVAQARDLYEVLLKAEPDSADTLLSLAKCDVAQKNLGAARNQAEAALVRQPRHGEANALMGYLLVEADRPGEAIVHLRMALKDPALPHRETVERLLGVATSRTEESVKPASGTAPAAVHPSGGAAKADAGRRSEVK